MVVSDRHMNEPSNKRRRCLVGEERLGKNDSSFDQDLEAAEVPTQQPQQEATTPPQTTASGSSSSGNKKPVCTVYIGGLHPRITSTHLEKMCMPYGSIQRLHLCERKGYAFCQYATPAQAESAMQSLDGRGLLGRRLMVRPAHNDSQQHGNNNNRGGAAAAASQTTTTNPDKERERLESRIQALKRKLQDSNNNKPSSSSSS